MDKDSNTNLSAGTTIPIIDEETTDALKGNTISQRSPMDNPSSGSTMSQTKRDRLQKIHDLIEESAHTNETLILDMMAGFMEDYGVTPRAGTVASLQHEITSESSNEAIIPLHKQKRVWFGGAVAIGVVAAAIYLAVELSPGDTLTTTLMPSASPSPAPSAPPTLSNIPSHIPSSNPTSNEEKQENVLSDIYDAFGGESWNVSTGWNIAGVSMCSWYGVSCSTDGSDVFVDRLHLAANNLNGNLEELLNRLVDLDSLEVLDLDSNLMYGNLTAISNNLVQLSHLHEVDLRLSNFTGGVTAELCAHIGDGTLRVDCNIECDCCDHEVLCETCVDVPGWYDSLGDECAWYVFEDACVTDGDLYENDNHTANTACCDCGGGIIFDFRNPSPSSAPSLAPTKSPTVLESHHPSISPVPSQTPTESHQPSHSVSPSQPPTESHQPSISSQPTSYVCEDNHENCQFWAEQGECDTNPSYMHYNCRLACDKCD